MIKVSWLDVFPGNNPLLRLEIDNAQVLVELKSYKNNINNKVSREGTSLFHGVPIGSGTLETRPDRILIGRFWIINNRVWFE